MELNYVLLIISGFLPVFAIGQLVILRRSEANLILSILLFICFIWIVLGIGFMLGMMDAQPHLRKIYIPFLAASGPLWYLYVRFIVSAAGWTARDKKHLLPVLICFLFAIPFYIQSADFKREYIDTNVDGFVLLTIYLASRLTELTAIAYLSIALHKLRTRNRDNNSLGIRLNQIMSCLSMIAIVAVFASLFGSIVGNHTISIFLPVAITLVTFIGFYIVSHREPGLMVFSLKSSNTPKVATDEGKILLQNYRDQIKQENWYLNPNLKMQDLARKLGIPSTELSAFINRESGGNYKQFLNELRIEYSTELLVENPDWPIDQVAHESGFNSPSTYYVQFNRFKGKTPALYRQQALKTPKTNCRSLESDSKISN